MNEIHIDQGNGMGNNTGSTSTKYPSRLERNQRSRHRLPRKVNTALVDFRQRILNLFPGQVSQIILYGSYASGQARPDSDVDVMVVVRWTDPEYPGRPYWGRPSDPRWQQIINAAMDSMSTGTPYLSAIVVGENLLDQNIPVIEEAKREGKILWTSQRT